MSEREAKRDVPKDGEECYHCGRGGQANAQLIDRVNTSEAHRNLILAKLHQALNKITSAMEGNGLRANPDRAERFLLSALSGTPMRRKDD